MTYTLINFEQHKINVIVDIDYKIWFNAKQICLALQYKDAKKAIINNVDKEDKIQFKNMKIDFKIVQHRDSMYINESGLYSLLIKSRTRKAKKFIKWLTTNVLPNLRKNQLFPPDTDITKLLQKINKLEKVNKTLKNDLKLEKFPEGSMVYVTEENDDENIYYRIGKTENINKRLNVHNTHSIHNKKVVYFIETICPLQLETCIRSMLYKYRIKNKKDYYQVELGKIKKAINKCIDSIKCIEKQSGGNIIKITYYENKLNKLYDLLTMSTID